MAVKVMTRVWDHSSHSASDLLVLLSLADRCDEDGVCWPGIKNLAEKSRLQERQTQRVIAKLRKSGELFVLEQQGQDGGRGWTNLYFVTIGLSAYEIEDVLIRRFEFDQEQAKETADRLIDTQNGGDFGGNKRVSSKTPKKGVIQDASKRVSSKTKRVSSKTKKGVIAMTPDTSCNHHDPSEETSFGANAQQPENQPEERPPKESSLSQQMFSALADLCKYDLSLITEKERGQLNQTEKKMREGGITPDDLASFSEWWYANDWRGKKNQPPTISNMRQTWGQFKDCQKNGGRKTNGTHRTNIAGLRGRAIDNPIKKYEDINTGRTYWKDIRTGQEVPAPPGAG